MVNDTNYGELHKNGFYRSTELIASKTSYGWKYQAFQKWIFEDSSGQIPVKSNGKETLANRCLLISILEYPSQGQFLQS